MAALAREMATPGAISTGTIYCIAGGTRGDQQPLIMTAKRLQAMGYNIIMCIGTEGKDWIKQWGFEMIEFASFEKVVNENQAVRASAESGNFTDFFDALGESLSDNVPKEITAVYDAFTADKSAVGIVCTSTHWYVATVLQRKLGIYGMSMFMSPFFHL
jgi:UDP:flavonoid glycosyltransferase YjiC (YdhE family)